MSFSGFSDGHDADMADINVTPLVDVMLVLLIVFMLSMPVFTSAVKVELPKSGATHPPEEDDIVRVTVDRDGHYFLRDESLTRDALVARLTDLKTEHPGLVVALHADKNVRYEAVALLLDAARERGIVKVGFVNEVQAAAR